jgi:CBS-domain-containing membrane protein
MLGFQYGNRQRTLYQPNMTWPGLVCSPQRQESASSVSDTVTTLLLRAVTAAINSSDLTAVLGAGLVVRGVITVPATCSAFEAIVTMRSKSISAVAVVDEEGCLLGNFSTSQMRTIMSEEFGALALPVSEFLPPSRTREVACTPLPSPMLGYHCFFENVFAFLRKKT